MKKAKIEYCSSVAGARSLSCHLIGPPSMKSAAQSEENSAGIFKQSMG
jgi:hypothetical protein